MRFSLSMDDDMGNVIIQIFERKSDDLQELVAYANRMGANDYHHSITEYAESDPDDPYGSDRVGSARLFEIPETANDLSNFIEY